MIPGLLLEYMRKAGFYLLDDEQKANIMIIHAVVGNLIDLGEQHVQTTENTRCLVCK